MKKITILLACLILMLSNSFSFEKKEFDEFADSSMKFVAYKKYNLLDYIPHSDGEIDIYKIKDAVFYIYAGIYTSMNKTIYSIKIEDDTVEGYIQKFNYLESYNANGTQIEDPQIISGTIKSITDSKSDKILQVIFDILEEDY